MSLYFLSPQANSGNSITKHPLNGDNYIIWEKVAILTLKSHDKLDFITGTIPKPDSTSKDLKSWEVVNSTLCSWLYNSLDPSILGTVYDMTEAKDIWDSLKTRFSIPNRLRIFKLHYDMSLTKQDGSSVIMYYTKLLGMWGQLNSLSPVESCGCPKGVDKSKKDEELRIYQFLMGLDDMYSTLRTNIINMDPFRT